MSELEKDALPVGDEALVQPEADPGAGSGALRAAREAAGMSVEQVAATLRLAPRQVVALEAGDWEALPGVAFVRGALRSYGRLVRVDVEALLASVEPAGSTHLRPAPSLGVTLPRNTVIGFGEGEFGHRWVWIALAVVGLIAIAMYFAGGSGLSGVASWISRTGDSNEIQAPAAPGTVVESLPIAGAGVGATEQATATPPAIGDSAAAPAATQPVVTAPASDAAAASSPATGATVSATPPAAPQAATAGPAPAAAPSPASATAASAAAGTTPALHLSFGRQSWVEIRDAGGAILLQGIQPADSERSLDGKPPFSMVIGNAAHVRVERAGRSVKLEPAPSSGVARLTVE